MPVKRLSPAVPISHARPVRQARSRRTLERLLDATEASLEREGLDGTTVPAIAGRAGVSVGVVYRRFPDKDALLRAVYERFFARAREGNRAALAPARWKDVPTGALARALVLGMVQGYRQRPDLLRALFLYSQTHDDPRFRRRAERVTSEASPGSRACSSPAGGRSPIRTRPPRFTSGCSLWARSCGRSSCREERPPGSPPASGSTTSSYGSSSDTSASPSRGEKELLSGSRLRRGAANMVCWQPGP